MERVYDVSEETRQVLLDAGWYPGRAVDTAQWEAELVADGFSALHDAARRFLSEFGGLFFFLSGPGITCARESFNLAPTNCLGEWDRFIEWSEHIGRAIAPIGDTALTCAHAFLGIDERGRVLRVIDSLETYGTMPWAMDGLVLGYMPREIA